MGVNQGNPYNRQELEDICRAVTKYIGEFVCKTSSQITLQIVAFKTHTIKFPIKYTLFNMAIILILPIFRSSIICFYFSKYTNTE